MSVGMCAVVDWAPFAWTAGIGATLIILPFTFWAGRASRKPARAAS